MPHGEFEITIDSVDGTATVTVAGELDLTPAAYDFGWIDVHLLNGETKAVVLDLHAERRLSAVSSELAPPLLTDFSVQGTLDQPVVRFAGVQPVGSVGVALVSARDTPRLPLSWWRRHP